MFNQNPLKAILGFIDPFLKPYLMTRSESIDEKQVEMDNTRYISEAILAEILARLPLRSISRFKSVCKTWKSGLKSVYFRRLFVSLHQNSSSSWSLMCETRQVINLHGCKTWDLPKSLASYIPNSLASYMKREIFFSGYPCSNGLVSIEGGTFGYACYVGNPVLQQWVKIPSSPFNFHAFGLVTRVDEDGVVLSFKVVRARAFSQEYYALYIYSSETWIWTYKRTHCPLHIPYSSSLNGTLHILSTLKFDIAEPGALIAHDFYSDSDQWRLIPLP